MDNNHSKLQIRPATIADANRIQTIYSPYIEKSTVSFEYETPSVEEMASRIENYSKTYPYLVAESNGKVIGYVYAKPFSERQSFDYTSELSIYVDQEATARGVGKSLLQAIEQSLVDMGIVQLVSTISLPNNQSVNFHKKNGFNQIGHFPKAGYKFNKWHDIIWMVKTIGSLDDK